MNTVRLDKLAAQQFAVSHEEGGRPHHGGDGCTGDTSRADKPGTPRPGRYRPHLKGKSQEIRQPLGL